MAQLDSVKQVESFNRLNDHNPQLFNATFTNSNADYFNACGDRNANGSLPGLPKLEIVGFDREPQKNPFLQPADCHTWGQSVLRALGFGASVEDRLKDQVTDRYVSGLTNEQKREWRKEEERMDNYRAGCGLALEPPKCPMHDHVKQMTRQLEGQLAQQVRANMTDKEREELDKGLKSIDDQYKNPNRPGLAPIEVPQVVRDYYRAIAHAADDPQLKIPAA